GCTGIISTLNLAQALLNSENDYDSTVLITSENDMMVHAHQRCTRYATVDNINHWMWPAIFGEGVGALLVGKASTILRNDNQIEWVIENHFLETVENDWRVTHHCNQDNNTVYQTKWSLQEK
ncbi:hypothetical protein MBAV_006178, partial [Candidatus Magnetobacterium bavaricum]